MKKRAHVIGTNIISNNFEILSFFFFIKLLKQFLNIMILRFLVVNYILNICFIEENFCK